MVLIHHLINDTLWWLRAAKLPAGLALVRASPSCWARNALPPTKDGRNKRDDEKTTQRRTQKMPRNTKRRSHIIEEESEDDEPTMQNEDLAMGLSSQAPPSSQEIADVRDSDQRNLLNMSEEKREKAIVDISRLVLFKAMAGSPIDRPKVIKEAGVSDARISTAVFKEVDERLQHCFGFSLTQIPDWMKNQTSISKSLKDRYYVINMLHDETGEHTRALHSVFNTTQKGFLMAVLALCYCKGEAKADGSRWISDVDLYRYLNRMDDSLPSEPPAVGGRRAAGSTATQRNQNAPNPDALLHLCIQQDYLLKEKGEQNDNSCLVYSIGPRSVLEIGNEQVLRFCAEILEEEIDPVMLQELRAMENMEEA